MAPLRPAASSAPLWSPAPGSKKVDLGRRVRAGTGTPALRPMTTEERNKQLWAGATMDTLKQMGLPKGPPPS